MIWNLEPVGPEDIFSAALQDVLNEYRRSPTPEGRSVKCYYLHFDAGDGGLHSKAAEGELLFYPYRGRGYLAAESLCWNLRGLTPESIICRWQEQRLRGKEKTDGNSGDPADQHERVEPRGSDVGDAGRSRGAAGPV